MVKSRIGLDGMEAVARLGSDGKSAGFPGRHIGHLQGTDRSAAMDGNGYHMAFLARGQGKKKDNEAETLSHRHRVKEDTRQGANRAGNKDKKKGEPFTIRRLWCKMF